ncbi:MAG TPA: helix-turn-helix domain-containing protein [Acidimicrobiales bacterium]|nr:helix-turn-helix domain-containing protein [Acidimicrobiales bacterium]
MDEAQGMALPITAPRAVVHGDPTLLPARVASLLGQVATQLDGQAEEIAMTMVRAYEREIPAYCDIVDEALLDDVRVVSSALVRCWLTVMATGGPAPDELLVPLLEGARRRVAQGFDMQSLLRAYRIGIRVMWSEITASPVWRGRPLQGALAMVGTWVLGFADQICTGIAAAFMDETARVTRELEHRRSALLNIILAGPGSEHLHGPEELQGPHCVVVAGVAPDLSLLELEDTGKVLEEVAGARLWTVRHCSVVAAVSLPDGTRRDQLRRQLTRLADGQRIVTLGIGGRAEGMAETRHSYSEAVDALRFGPHLWAETGPVYDYLDMAAVLSLINEPVRARRFMTEALAPLGDLVQREWVLPTIEAFLLHQGRLKEIAAALNVHQSTVKYRVNELRLLIDSNLRCGDKAATLLIAVRLHQLMGPDQAGYDRAPPACGAPRLGRASRIA